MAITVGELVAYAQVDKSNFSSGVQGIGSDLNRLQSSTSSSMASMESTVTRSFAEIEQSIKDGFDPDEAIRDLDRLHASLNADLDKMLDEADDFDDLYAEIMSDAFDVSEEAHHGGQQAVQGLRRGLDGVDQVAHRAGQDGGDELVDGLRAGVRDAEQVTRRAGEDAGREFGDGVESEGRGRMSGVSDTLMSGLKTAGVGLALAAGAAIGAALMSGLEGALDAEKAKAKLFAQIGATESEMGKLGKVAGAVYADGYGEGLGDVTESIKSLIQNVDGIRGASEESLGTLSKRALDASTILDEDVSRVTAAVGQILKNDLAPNAEAAFDVIVKGAQSGVNKSEDLLDTFNEYGTQFRELGLDAETALGLMSQGLQAGARDADTVADALKEFAIRSKDGSKTSTEAFQAIGLNAKDMFQTFAKGGPGAKAALGDVIDRLKDVKDPVEQDAIAVGLFGTKAEDLQDALYALDPSTAVDSLGQVDGAAKKAGDTLHDTASNKIEQWKRGLQQGVVDFVGGTVLPALEELAEGFDFSAISAQVQEWADDLGEIWDSVVADVQEWVAANGETIEEWKTKLSEGFASAKEVVDDALAILKELWDEYGDDIIESVTFLVDSFLSIWNGFWGVVSGALKVVKGVLTGDFEEIKAGLTKIWDSLWGAIEDQVTRTLDLVKKIASETWENLKKDAEAAWKRISDAVDEGVDAAVKYVQELPGKIQKLFANAGTWLLRAGSDTIDGYIAGIRAKASAVVDAVKSVVGLAEPTAKSTLKEHSPSQIFADIGGNTILGFINGVVDKGKDLAAAMLATVDTAVVGTAKQATGTGTGSGGGGGARPSTVMAEIGKYTVKGLIDGLTAEGANIKGVVDKLVADIKAAFKSTPDVVDGLLDFVRTGNKSLEALAKQRQELVEQLAAAKEYAKQVAGSAEEWASITGLKAEDLTGAGDMASELKGKASAINEFANNIQTLAKRGLNKKIIQDIIDAGVEKGASFAEMLVGSDGAEIKALNKAQAAVDKASKKLGKASADAMFDVGKKSGEGYLKGLEASLKDLDKEMKKIVDALVKAIKRELKIKSPSQVMAEIGVYTMAGYIEGMQSMESSTLAAMTGIVGKAVSATSDAAIGSVGKAAAASTTKIGIQGAASSTDFGVPFASNTGGTWGGTTPAPTPSGVTVNMHDTVIREEADIDKVGAQFGFQYSLRGNV